MIAKTSGIVLRVDPFSRTSSIVTWLSPDIGKLVTVAKGARRVRHPFLGQFDVFQSCEFLFYRGRHSTLHLLKECSIEKVRPRFRDDWRASVCASYLCDLVVRLTPHAARQTGLSAFLGGVLDFMEEQGATMPVLHWAEINLLRLLGVAPKLAACVACGIKPSDDRHIAHFAVARGGIVCAKCRAHTAGPVLPVSPDVLAMLRSWQNASSPRMAQRTTCTPEQERAVSALIAAFLHYHLESSSARDIAMGLAAAGRSLDENGCLVPLSTTRR